VKGAGVRVAVRALPALVAVAAVADLAAVHAADIGHYPWLGDPGRVGWEASYAALLAVAGYVAGVADPPRRRVDAVVASATAAAGAALAISVVQLAVGSAVLPRFVVFGSIAVVLPGDVLAARLGDRVRRAHEQLDRVVAVVTVDEAVALERDLGRSAERPATLVAVLGVEEARPGCRPQPLVDAATACQATVLVLDRAAQGDEAVVAQAAVLHGAGVRVRTLSLFYDEWLGKLPVGELERMSLMFDIQELHGRLYARCKRMVDVAVALVGCLVLAMVAPVVAAGVGPSPSSSSGPCRRSRPPPRRRGRGWPTPGWAVSAGGCAAPIWTSCRRCSMCCAASCPWSVPGPSSPATWKNCGASCPSTTCGTWCTQG
jgi:hypothetical protein